MIQENMLTMLEISRELNTGTAFTKFLLNRFEKFLSPDTSSRLLPLYSQKDVSLLLEIKHFLDSGLLPSQIEEDLANRESDEMTGLAGQFLTGTNEDIRVSKDGLKLIKSLFSDISDQQRRIAAAHEKRAMAEERKAVAIEKRAAAEEKKASAMNNIAMALQEMNRMKIQSPETMQIVHHASSILDPDSGVLENFGSGSGKSMADSDLENELDNLSELLEKDEIEGESPPVEPFGTEDCHARIQDGEEPGIQEKRLQISDDLSRLLEDDQALELSCLEIDQTDDLNQLIDAVSMEREASAGLDDLFLLLEQEPDLDDLSLLLDPGDPRNTASPSGPEGMDDLCLLIEDEDQFVSGNLSEEDSSLEPPMDDLSLLLDKVPSLKPEITPQEDIEAYKAEVMKIIIQLKSQGTRAQETARRLNQDQVPTLSGKPEWSVKALKQIYTFIDSAR